MGLTNTEQAEELWTPERQRESAVPVSPLMQRLEALEEELKKLARRLAKLERPGTYPGMPEGAK